MPRLERILTKQNKVLFLGVLLGDAHCFEYKGQKQLTAQLKFAQSKDKHPEYLEHLFNICKDILKIVKMEKPTDMMSSTSSIIPTKKIRSFFSTLLLAELHIYRKMFYPEKTKIVPYETRKLLSPIAIAYWYMDDGSLKGGRSQGLIFNTLGFSIYDVFLLCDVLRREHNILCWPRQQKNLRPDRN